MPTRLVLFGESRSFISTALAAAAIRAARRRADVEVVAICETGRKPPPGRITHAARATAVALVKRAFDADQPIVLHRPMLERLHEIARGARIPLVVPPEHDVNAPDFVEVLASRFRAVCALSLACVQVFGPELLAVFDQAINYHNGLLPAYRGLGATRWSVYHGEQRTGFTFHRMIDRIDDGPVLVQGSLPLPPRPSLVQLEWQKTMRAAAALDGVFDAIARREPGRPQEGSVSYFGSEERRRVQAIGEPGSVSLEELLRRLNAFDVVDVRIGRGTYPVSKVRPASGTSSLTFSTSDGVLLEPARLAHLPPNLYRLSRWLTERARER
jgi:methionyl-tRNA formyltransferase